MWIYILGIIQEYLVIINAYNGDIIPNIPNELQYCIPDSIILIYMLYQYKKINIIEFIFITLTFIAHFQWYFHSPFDSWPEWWISEKSKNDIRHRTEYYDTHVMCFTIYFLLFIRFLDKKKT
jgi:hypothetical protein